MISPEGQSGWVSVHLSYRLNHVKESTNGLNIPDGSASPLVSMVVDNLILVLVYPVPGSNASLFTCHVNHPVHGRKANP